MFYKMEVAKCSIKLKKKKNVYIYIKVFLPVLLVRRT